jgi:hypothetical protein
MAPTRKRRAVGRIEHLLLVGDIPPTDLRPPPTTRPYHKKVTSVSFSRGETRAGEVEQRAPRPVNDGAASTSGDSPPLLRGGILHPRDFLVQDGFSLDLLGKDF